MQRATLQHFRKACWWISWTERVCHMDRVPTKYHSAHTLFQRSQKRTIQGYFFKDLVIKGTTKDVTITSTKYTYLSEKRDLNAKFQYTPQNKEGFWMNEPVKKHQSYTWLIQYHTSRISGTLWDFLWDSLDLSVTVWGCLGLTGTLLDSPGLSEELSGTVWDCLGLSVIVSDSLGLFRTF